MLGGCQNYGPFLDPYYNTAPDIQGTPKEIITLTTTTVFCAKNLNAGNDGSDALGNCCWPMSDQNTTHWNPNAEPNEAQLCQTLRLS